MAYEDWSDSFRELFDETPGTSYLDDSERSYAEALFETGFTFHGSEYDSQGLDPDQVEAIRDEFFEFMGLGENGELFDWHDWKEAMGYE